MPGGCRRGCAGAAELTRTISLGFLFILIYFLPSPAFILSRGEWKEVWAGSTFSEENRLRAEELVPTAVRRGLLRMRPESVGMGTGIDFWGEAARSSHLSANRARNKRSWMGEPGKKIVLYKYIYIYVKVFSSTDLGKFVAFGLTL